MGALPPAQDLRARLDRIDELIRGGALSRARHELQLLLRRRIERRFLERAANLARQAFLPERTLQLLHRFVRPRSSMPEALRATEEELAVYAAALNQLGASR